MGIRVKQRDITDCGAACLMSIASYYKVNLPLARIRQYAGTDKKGTNILGLIEAAEKIGFTARGVKADWDNLFKIPVPSIAHVVVKGILTHYVVILKTTNKHIKIMDPGDGETHKIEHNEFKEQWTGVLVLIAPGERFRIRDEKEKLWTRLLHLVKPSKNILIQALVGAFAYSILGLSLSIYIGRLVDNVIPGGNYNLLNLLGIGMIIIIIYRFSLIIFQSVYVLKTGQRIDASLILGYYQQLMKLPKSFFDNMRTGEIISRIGDAVKIRVFVNDVSISLVLNLFILAVSFVIMFAFYWKLALIVLCVIPFYYLIYFISNKLNKKTQRVVMERSADLEAQLVESLSSAATIKRFSLEDIANLKTESRFVSLLDGIYKSGMNSIFSSTSSGLVTQLITVLVMWVGTGYVLNTQITAGELLSFYAIIGYFTGPVTGVINYNRTLQDARIAADRLFEIFDLDPEENNGKIELMPNLIGDIHFDSVSFRYGTRMTIFESLTLTIKKGRFTAIVGESGSGKTTIISLLHRLYPLNGGCIRVGGNDISNFTISSLRKKLACVPQEIELFTSTIAENIAPAELNPDMNKILEVCSCLGMSEFIEKLPGGFNTMLGEHGAKISGGQRQLIAIARALYLDPEILILDEATSSLDPISESSIQKALSEFVGSGRTLIVIAHRLSTIRRADLIYVLHQGKVVQSGTFSALVRERGCFLDMLKHQGFLLDYHNEQENVLIS
ncbi:MAG: peptidase domain-containing ABC transporter [Bacteroidales bacterium]|jgi:ATP-binding cassette subfamily B protein|nr:peptidase domain-containing ABC transporter [Bacteroidales bacterium]